MQSRVLTPTGHLTAEASILFRFSLIAVLAAIGLWGPQILAAWLKP